MISSTIDATPEGAKPLSWSWEMEARISRIVSLRLAMTLSRRSLSSGIAAVAAMLCMVSPAANSRWMTWS